MTNYLLRSLSFRCFDRSGEIGFVSEDTGDCTTLDGEMATVARLIWSAAARPVLEEELAIELTNRNHPRELVAETLAKLLEHQFLGVFDQGEINRLFNPPKEEPVCGRLLVCVTGAIQAGNIGTYLALLKEHFCAEMKVILTKAALKLVQPKFLRHLLASEVFTDVFDDVIGVNGVPHIWLSDWADCVLVAPSSASSIARIAGATCNDLLSLTVTATPRGTPIVLAPSMNVRMWDSESVRSNVERCRANGCWIIEPSYGVEVNQDWDKREPIDGAFGVSPSLLVATMINLYEMSQEGYTA